jgi:peptidoglycan/LPS O-acetylase OafA/YrhL
LHHGNLVQTKEELGQMDNRKITKEESTLLDGWRGLSIIMVVLYHYYFPATHWAWMSIDLFFLLSGFFITHSLVNLKEQQASSYFKKFYINRILRIFPLYYVVLAGFFIVLPKVFPGYITPSYQVILEKQIYFWLQIQNFYFAFNGWTDNVNFLHFWSLATEIQFYILWAWVVWKLQHYFLRFKKLLLLLIVLAIVFRLCGNYVFNWHQVFNYTLLLSRISSFAFGSLLFLLWKTNQLQKYKTILWWFAIIIPTLITIYIKLGNTYGLLSPAAYLAGYELNALFWFSLIGLSLIKANKILVIFSSHPILVFFGKISYSLYIFHQPIKFVLYKLLEPYTLSHYALAAITFVIIVLVSTISYYGFEKPILKFKYKHA